MGKEKKIRNLEAYYTHAPLKLAVLSVCTFGLYQWTWFSRNWKAYRRRTGRFVSPFLKTLFAPVLAFGMFSNIAETARAHDLDPGYPPVLLAFAFFMLWFVHLIPGHWGLLALGNFMPMLLANNVAINVNRKLYPDMPEDDRLGFGHAVVILVGSAILFLLLYFEFFPPQFATSGSSGAGSLREQLEQLQMIRDQLR